MIDFHENRFSRLLVIFTCNLKVLVFLVQYQKPCIVISLTCFIFSAALGQFSKSITVSGVACLIP